MTKCKKNKLFNAINTLVKACIEFVGCYCQHTQQGITDSIQILTACQEAAIAIGTSIEKIEGEGTETVRLLEEYCELLYETGSTIDQPSFSINRMSKALEKKLHSISHSLEYEIKTRMEVVFLPYKASMWDSLESVWQEADKDETCDAYVVPIPYYSLNHDGSQRQLYYEGDVYPEYVPVTSYKKYDIAERCPDKIFIHNPYDSCNKVTSVLPEFYASELKKYTDMLIYIPYFVCINNEVAKHFIVLPGTIYADKVVLQSEAIRDEYIKEFRRQMKQQGMEGLCVNLEEKFLAYGSPKIDKVLATTRDSVIIPEQWEKLLGQKNELKKVILYNTSLQSLMDAPEIYFNKVERVLELFKNNTNVVLLWRPHPLMMDTLEGMYPELTDRYISIVKHYKDEQWGIYDDTPDVNRAIALSDAYYGDFSSVVEMYKATGKPIMIQNLLI